VTGFDLPPPLHLFRLPRLSRGAAAAVLVLAAGSAAVALAVAPLAPDAADLPQRWVSETLTPLEAAPQLEALAAAPLSLWRDDITRAADTADVLLKRLGVIDSAAVAFLRTDPLVRQALNGRGGKMVQALADAQGRLHNLTLRFPAEKAEQAKTHFTRLTVDRLGGEGKLFFSRTETVPLEASTRLASGTIASSLYAATDQAGLPDSIAAQLAELFSADIDFHRQLRKGDSFSVVYETLLADGRPVAWNEGAGRLLAAEFINGGKAFQAVWFEHKGKGQYFDAAGNSRKRVFLASPLPFSRVTSGFAMRMHPILQRWRQHNGVDYAAPTGTPVRSVGDGVVSFAGWQNGYGNTVVVQHANSQETLYAHLSRKNVRQGQRIAQGELIGAVGATGWATGPHLHFEFRVRGVHQDPLQLARQTEAVALDAAGREQFTTASRRAQVKLDLAESAAAGRLRFE
jgi:murein DD-endopeptidase MepM/ murein hydrolase activator NlpD